jgi:hypothetical protein
VGHDKARIGEDIFKPKAKERVAANGNDLHQRLIMGLERSPALIQAL